MLYRDGTRLIIRDHAFRPSLSPGRRRKIKAPPRRQQARTAITRRRLLAAAAEVFARDGFEAARLEDIASLAGYTRGAFYANFDSKEDIFFALIEEDVAERTSELRSQIDFSGPPENIVRALRRHFAEVPKNRNLALLSMEFRLFAIRRPKAHERLLARHARMRSQGADFMRRLAKRCGRTRLPISATAAAEALGTLSNALILHHLLDHTGISENEIESLLGMYLDSLLGISSGK